MDAVAMFAAACTNADKRTQVMWDLLNGDRRFQGQIAYYAGSDKNPERWCIEYDGRGEVCGNNFQDMVQKAVERYTPVAG